MIVNDEAFEWIVKLYHSDHKDWWVNRKIKFRSAADAPTEYVQLMNEHSTHHYAHKLQMVWNRRKYGEHSNWVVQSVHKTQLPAHRLNELPADGIAVEDREVKWTGDVDRPAFYSGPDDQKVDKIEGTTTFHRTSNAKAKPVVRYWSIVGNAERLAQSNIDELIRTALVSGWDYKALGPISEYQIGEQTILS